MAQRKRDVRKADRERLRQNMRKNGHTHIDQIAAAMRHHWQYGYFESYRRAVEYTQPKICDVINARLGLNYGDRGSIELTTYSIYERWPYIADKRRPAPMGVLVALADFYGTTPDKLVDPIHIDLYPPVDRLALAEYARLNAAKNDTAKGSEPDTVPRIIEESRPQAGEPHISWDESVINGLTDPTERQVVMAAARSAAAGDQSGPGPLTLEQLSEETTRLARMFATAPRLTLFGAVKMLQDRVFFYLEGPGRRPPNANRDLHFLAAAACGMLAEVSDDLGYPGAAMSHLQAAHLFAREAGANDLDAWLYALQSTYSYWNGQPKKSREYARMGQELNPAGTVTIFLPALEARAAGALGDRPSARAALNRATDARAAVQPGNLDEFGGIMSCNQAKQDYYATGTYLGIGDYSASVRQADTTAQEYQREPAENQAHDNVAIARFQAGVAQVRLGDLDAAKHYAEDGLNIVPAMRTNGVEVAARKLRHELSATNLRGSQLAIETRDQIEDFLTVTPTQPLTP